jgi:hypothetical protein
VAELHRIGFAAVFAADADFQVRPGRPALLDRDLHQAAEAFPVNRLERIAGRDVVLLIVADERAVIVAAHAERRLRQVVGAEAEELRFFGDLIRHHASARQFDHRADEVFHFDAFFLEDFLGRLVDDFGLRLEFRQEADRDLWIGARIGLRTEIGVVCSKSFRGGGPS